MSSIADIPVTSVAKESVILLSGFFAVSCFTSCLTSGFSIGAENVGGGDESMVLQNSCRVGYGKSLFQCCKTFTLTTFQKLSLNTLYMDLFFFKDSSPDIVNWISERQLK